MREMTIQEFEKLAAERLATFDKSKAIPLADMVNRYTDVQPPCKVVSTRADGAFEFALKMAKAGYKINLSGVNGELWTVIVNEAVPTDKEGK